LKTDEEAPTLRGGVARSTNFYLPEYLPERSDIDILLKSFTERDSQQ
jgi:hypothetical protein